MAACDSLKFLSFIPVLAFFEVSLLNPIRQRRIGVIPSVLSGLVAADQQHGVAPRINGIHHAIRSASVLDPQLAHRENEILSMPKL